MAGGPVLHCPNMLIASPDDHMFRIEGINALVVNRALLTYSANGHKRHLVFLKEEKRKVLKYARGTKRWTLQVEISELQKKDKSG